jgi:hypothetical protein
VLTLTTLREPILPGRKLSHVATCACKSLERADRVVIEYDGYGVSLRDLASKTNRLRGCPGSQVVRTAVLDAKYHKRSVDMRPSCSS